MVISVASLLETALCVFPVFVPASYLMYEHHFLASFGFLASHEYRAFPILPLIFIFLS
jgi:hypothetical protein